MSLRISIVVRENHLRRTKNSYDRDWAKATRYREKGALTAPWFSYG
jgi:hypothetical protein